MRYETRLTAYDMLDQVVVGCVVWDSTESAGGVDGAVLVAGTSFAGQGETDPRTWLKDALVAMIERL